MKKIIYSIIAILMISLSYGTYYFYNQNKTNVEEVETLEKEVKELKKDIKKLQENINTQDQLITIYKAVIDDNANLDEKIKDSGYSNIKLISVNQLIDLMAEDQDFILLISQTYCSHCVSFKPIYNEVLIFKP